MGNKPSERDDTRGGLGASRPQDGPIGGTDDDRHVQDNEDALATGGTGDGALGQGGQRHPGGSSRDSDKQS